MTERTPLRASSAPHYDPQYVFNAGQLYKNKVRHFQCCVCAMVLACFVVVIIGTVAYSVDNDTDDAVNSSTPDKPADDVLVSLLTLHYPLSEQNGTCWYGQTLSAAQLQEALDTGLQDRDKSQVATAHLDRNSPSYRHQMAVRTGPEATRLARAGYTLNLAMRHLAARGLWRPRGSRDPVGQGPMVEADWMPPEACADTASTPCPSTPFRSADGSCNNHLHPFKWGIAMRPFRRSLSPDYADGVMAPRQATDGGALPSARDVSIMMRRPRYKDDPKFTVMLAVWGQFIDHDITATALSTDTDGNAILCCGVTPQHPECFPVRVSAADPYYHQFNLSCMEFVRSAPAPTCSLGPREQLNQVSAFLDGSVVYGPSLSLTSQLRSKSGGRLRMSVTPDGRTLLPHSTDPSDGCNQKQEMAQGRYCFISGDARANENLHLTTMHLLWARQHNLVADWLNELNPSWDDERVFQEARRIVVAQLQHITYSEFLPILLGGQLMSRLDLHPQPSGYFHGYNKSVDASIANSFAAAAFRFGHTLLPGLVKMLVNGTEEYVELHRMLFNPYSLYTPGLLDGVITGTLNTQVKTVVSKELTEHLFEQETPSAAPHGAPCGLDLVSLNIQRGRDHGLPTYTAWRERCGLSRPQTFSDMQGFMDSDSLMKLNELYRSVSDIDLYIGGMAEKPLEGGFLGPTITCLVTDQFVRLKKGDRFWYETPETPQAFTPGQLDELRKTSLARIICDNADSLPNSQPFVMRTVGPGNKRVPCGSIPGPDLSSWRDDGQPATRANAPSTRLEAHITSGHVHSDTGSVLWDGHTPLPLPARSSFRCLWSGTVRADSLHGIFSLQHGPQQWMNGQFFFQIFLDWFQSGPWEISGTFMSPIYFKEVGQFRVPASHPPSVELSGNFSLNPSVQTTSKPVVMPVVLEGAYSGDRTVFWWSGSIILTLPSSSQYRVETNGKFSQESETDNTSSTVENSERVWN
ncbi:peroxidase-like isoform X2 [Zootermopsis nevadensis]|nr:peroxidase-like isoform X2 [Zootermopsis nevadensis]